MAVQHDAGHFSFLQIIKVLTEIAGPAFAQGALIKTGISAAKDVNVIEFATLEDFVSSAERLDNPISAFEGVAVHYGDAIFGLPQCPFAVSIKNYKAVMGELPQEYGEVTKRLNKSSGISEKFRIGEGAAVSPFCGVHQSIRSAYGKKVRIAGHHLNVYQLGCKSGGGKKGLAHRWLDHLQIEEKVVDRILDENMCCYCLRLESDTN
jgi:hypothetical protein